MGQAAYIKKIQIETSSGVFTALPATTASMSAAGDVLDDTELATNAAYRTRIYGLRDWSMAASCLWGPSDAALEFCIDAWMNKTPVTVRYLPDGNADSPGHGFEGNAVVASYNAAGDVGGLETVELSFQADGAIAIAS